MPRNYGVPMKRAEPAGFRLGGLSLLTRPGIWASRILLRFGSTPDKTPESSEPRPGLYPPLPKAGFARLRSEWNAAMSTRTHFLYRIDMWTIDGQKVIEQLAGAEDFKVAMATYRAACARWPGTAITLRQGARVIEAPIRPREVTLA
jgi:hypothetical protein